MLTGPIGMAGYLSGGACSGVCCQGRFSQREIFGEILNPYLYSIGTLLLSASLLYFISLRSSPADRVDPSQSVEIGIKLACRLQSIDAFSSAESYADH
jgi:hypothetical protein